MIFAENGYNIHRKGATPAHTGQLALIPGSMGDYSFVALGLGNPEWLSSCSHGAGRAIKRQAMRQRIRKQENHGHHLPFECITLKSERLIEESPLAYKPITPVIKVQEEAGLIQPIVKLKPWITFKAS
jgi:tRNA-splicing ligase RtcB